MPTEWEKARGESMNYVEEVMLSLKPYSYASAADVSATHKELCRVLQARLAKAAENAHLGMDFLRGPRSGDLEKAARNLKDDIEILRDEVTSSYVEWKSPRSNIIREIISKDAQILRESAAIMKLSEQFREAALSRVPNMMLQHAVEANDRLSKLSYLFSDRERLCR